MRKGYTLVEAVVVVSAVAVLAVTILPSFGSFRFSRNLERDRRGAVAALRTAQARAMAGAGDAAWGVRFSPTEYVLYKGPTYDVAGTDNVRYRLSGSTFSGAAGQTVLFEKLRGTTANAGTLGFAGGDGRSAAVTVTAAGGIE
jgi:type II secretory pathway pseudopilin PulG